MRLTGKSICVFAFLCTMFFSFSAFASVTGTVTDTSGNPVSGALVTFTDESNTNNKFSDSTDAQGKYTINISDATGVDASTPSAFSLGQNYPNPFNPTTTIPFTLYSSVHVGLVIYNIMGQRVTTVIDDFLNPGEHFVTWNGMDEQGKHVSAGIYLYQLQAGRHVETKKMLLLDGGGGSNVAKPSMNSGTQIIAKKAAETTYTITIAYSEVIIYEKTGVTITDGQTMDLVGTLTGVHIVIQGITFVYIPSGTFRMGDIQGIGSLYETPVHTVTLSSFEMSIYEITQGQYQSVVGTNPSTIKSGDNYPVEQVSWYEAVRFCNKLSDAAGLERCYNDSTWACDFSKNGFRLPTEAEWEYSCKAGTETNFYNGNEINVLDDWKTSSDLDKAGWYLANSGGMTHPVGEKEKNDFGLYDMHGNVWELCNDWDGDYTSDSQTNPTGVSSGSYRVVRGGSYKRTALSCRSAYRYYSSPSDKYHGFRIVRRP